MVKSDLIHLQHHISGLFVKPVSSGLPPRPSDSDALGVGPESACLTRFLGAFQAPEVGAPLK